jgi:hypothetical protein
LGLVVGRGGNWPLTRPGDPKGKRRTFLLLELLFSQRRRWGRSRRCVSVNTAKPNSNCFILVGVLQRTRAKRILTYR